VPRPDDDCGDGMNVEPFPYAGSVPFGPINSPPP